MSGNADAAAEQPRFATQLRSSTPPRRRAAPARRRRRAATLAALTLTAVLAVAGVGASPAWAHAILERATPAGGTAAKTAPTQVTLGFSESVRADSSSIRVIDAHGNRVDTGGAHGGPTAAQVTVALKPDLPKGTYLVSWHVISEDSHPVAGGFAFGIGKAPSASEAAAASATPSGSSAVGFVFGTARLVAFAGTAVLLGGAFFLLVLWPAGLRRRAPRRVLVAGWVAAVLGVVASLLLQGPYGDRLGLSGLFQWAPLGSTLADRYGKLTLVRLLALVLALPLLRATLAAADRASDAAPEPSHTTRRPSGAAGKPSGAAREAPGPDAAGVGGRPSVWTRVELAGLAVATTLATALTGHGGAGSWAWLATTSLTAHLLAMSVWLGGLTVLATGLLDRRGRPATTDGEDWAEAVARESTGDDDLDDEAALAAARAYLDHHYAEAVPVPADRAAELAKVLPRWSVTAMVAVAVIVVSGIYQSWREVGALGALFDTAYGRLLLYKLWFVLAMLGIGFVSNRWVWRHFRTVALAMTAETDPGTVRAGGGDPAPDALADETFDAAGRRKVTVGALGVLRRGVLAEAAIGIAVLTVTAALVNRPPGRTTYAPPLHTTTTAGPLTVEVRVAPTQIGLETIKVAVRDPQGQPQQLVEASVTLALPAAQVGPIDVPMVADGVGRLVAQDAQVPLAGSWRLGITVRINDFDEYATTIPYTVR
jgi:copper transport protein